VLRTWDGRGAVRLLEADEDAGVLVLERAEPGASLWELTDERATVVAADVMRRLWRAADPAVELPTVVEWGRGFARHRAAHGGGSGPLPAALFAAAERRFAQLCATAGEPVLLHGDLHQGNVLSAAREPGWLAIDPKGVVGEPAYEPGAFLRNPIDGPAPFADPAATVRRRLDLLAGALRLDRVRLRDWAFAQAMLSAVWSLEDHGGGWEGAVAWAELLAAA
jgi:streptomycin 6-kinase